MAEKFVVYVSAPPEGEAEAAGNKLAELLKLEPSKVRSLVRRLPDVVTRPVSQREALAAGRRFQQAGLNAEVRDAQTHAVVTRLDAQPAANEGASGGVAWADEPETATDWARPSQPTETPTETPEERAYGRSSRIIEPKRPETEPEPTFEPTPAAA